jgi:hypothetical protein
LLVLLADPLPRLFGGAPSLWNGGVSSLVSRSHRTQRPQLNRPQLKTEVGPSAAKRAWAQLIKQAYEVDPLVCPRCGEPMRIIAFIEQAEVIEKILTHFGLWPTPAHSPPVDVSGAARPATDRVAA